MDLNNLRYQLHLLYKKINNCKGVQTWPLWIQVGNLKKEIKNLKMQLGIIK